MNHYFNPEKYIIYENNRVFIDISKEGCGSGCTYCYVPSKNESQKLLSIEEIEKICIYVYRKCHNKIKIVSLCPNTEPLKSSQSIELVLNIANFFSPKDCIIQISTKEKIPSYFLKSIESLNIRTYINISIPILKNNASLEPNAGRIEDRISNFKFANQYKNIVFSLYIKPFLNQAIDQYIELINHYKIGTIIIGPLFNNNSNIPCLSLYNNSTNIKNQINDIYDSVKIIKTHTPAKVFISSICKIHNDYNYKCPYLFLENKVFICKDCNVKGD